MIKSIIANFTTAGQIAKLSKTLNKVKDAVKRAERGLSKELDGIQKEFSIRMDAIETKKSELDTVKKFIAPLMNCESGSCTKETLSVPMMSKPE